VSRFRHESSAGPLDTKRADVADAGREAFGLQGAPNLPIAEVGFLWQAWFRMSGLSLGRLASDRLGQSCAARLTRDCLKDQTEMQASGRVVEERKKENVCAEIRT
jgi:hypothetical protein